VKKSQGSRSERKVWTRAAQIQLSAMIAAAAQLQSSLDSLGEATHDPIRDRASELLDKCTDVSNWLIESHPPLGTEDAVAELSAVAGVYRLAAITFRRLLETGVGMSPSLLKTCSAMLDQGGIHSDRFHSLAF